jgi:hydrogenase maturation protein HypF
MPQSATTGLNIRVRGLVQGVGFRPTVWRLARECGLFGHVLNDGGGVSIQIWGRDHQIKQFLQRLEAEPPPLARIDSVETSAVKTKPPDAGFHILHSEGGQIQTGVAPDAATCPSCLADIRSPENRRYRYPFTNCTHCGPRLSIIRTIPYDRIHTAMANFIMCENCQDEYDDPADRRFHAQPNACPECGPHVWLEGRDGEVIEPKGQEDAIAAACRLILQGQIVAIKGIGGFHLACDATNENAVETLRDRKHRYDKPFALLARDAAMVGQYAELDGQNRQFLEDKAAPIVLLHQEKETLARSVAPGQDTLGFMLPYTPLHHILMAGLDRPIVMTSGNRSDEPQCITNDAARTQLATIADTWLMHDRDIVNRLDDSVVRIVGGHCQTLRRARGYAPSPIRLPKGFDDVSPILAMGAELKNTFCLIREGEAVLSQHIGDLEDAATHGGYREALDLFARLYAFKPSIISVDMHPGYHSSQWGEMLAARDNLRLDKVQHHHAHIAACMMEHELPIDAKPVLGIALDGLGLGDDGSLWGGEFLLADYRRFERLAHFMPVAMIGGDKASRQPWRNTYAHLNAALGWEKVCAKYADLAIVNYLDAKPLHSLDIMVERGLNAPLASSAGRLFDAAAAAIGLHCDAVRYEGQAAIELEGLAASCDVERAGGYEIEIDGAGVLGWRLMWCGILDDLHMGEDAALIAARFHNTLADMIVQTAVMCGQDQVFETVVLSGGVFQNSLLLQTVSRCLRAEGFEVLSPFKVPANDGGISLGQAVISAARQ